MYTNNPVDTDLIHDVDLILSNDQEIYTHVRALCLDSVKDDDLSTNDVPAAYREAYPGNNDNWYGFVECAMLRVVEYVQDRIEAEVQNGFVYDLLTQRLDLGNRHAWSIITEKFMPEPDDVECVE